MESINDNAVLSTDLQLFDYKSKVPKLPAYSNRPACTASHHESIDHFVTSHNLHVAETENQVANSSNYDVINNSFTDTINSGSTYLSASRTAKSYVVASAF